MQNPIELLAAPLGLTEFLRLGDELRQRLSSEIREAEAAGWDARLVDRIRDGVEKYLRLAVRFSLILGTLAFVPVILSVIRLLQQRLGPWLVYGSVSLLAVLALFAVCLFIPLGAIIPQLRALPDKIYRDLINPLWWALEYFYLLVSVGLFCHLWVAWSFAASFPVLCLLGLLWLFAPWLLVLRKDDAFYLKMRVGQLGVLLTAVLLSVASPVPASHFQTWANRRLADKIRPEERREVTDLWRSLVWFSPEGAPNVWYSLTTDQRYRLFTAPGYDPDSKAEFKPVDSEAIKNRIIQTFLDAEKWEQTRQLESARQARIRDYVTAGTNRSGRVNYAVLVSLNGTPDQKMARWLTVILAKANIPAASTVFTPAYAASPELGAILAGKPPPSNGFTPADYCEKLLVGEATVTYESITQPAEMVTAVVELRLRIIAAANSAALKELVLDARGVGFKQAEALKMALERLETTLTARTKEMPR